MSLFQDTRKIIGLMKEIAVDLEKDEQSDMVLLLCIQLLSFFPTLCRGRSGNIRIRLDTAIVEGLESSRLIYLGRMKLFEIVFIIEKVFYTPFYTYQILFLGN